MSVLSVSARAPKVVIVRAWSAEWWLLLVRDIEAGRPVGFLVAQSSSRTRSNDRSRGHADGLRRSTAVPVAVGSQAFDRWSLYLARRHGAPLPRPDTAKFAFMPAALPPDLPESA
jgi:hypothetical protein